MGGILLRGGGELLNLAERMLRKRLLFL